MLGIPIPDRRGRMPRPAGNFARRRLLDEYRAHAKVWEVRGELAQDTSGSTFARGSAGFDIVCGGCRTQHIGVSEREAVNLVCDRCGKSIGTDLQVEIEAKRVVLALSEDEIAALGGPK
jgi:hypothetical protein